MLNMFNKLKRNLFIDYTENWLCVEVQCVLHNVYRLDVRLYLSRN